MENSEKALDNYIQEKWDRHPRTKKISSNNNWS